MRIMNRDECINIVNKLAEFKLITENQAKKIVSKRDNQERESKQ